MAQATLDEMIQEIAIYTDTTDDVQKTNGAYTGEALPYFNKFRTSLNYAINKIAKEKYSPIYRDTITLTSTLKVDLTTLTKTFMKVNRIVDEDNATIEDYEQIGTLELYFPNYGENKVLIIEYEYLPSALNNLTDVLDFPESIVDFRIPCYYATYVYFLIEAGARDKDSAAYYLNMFNDGFMNIINTIKPTKTVRIVQGGVLY